jgi:hypothetical protein
MILISADEQGKLFLKCIDAMGREYIRVRTNTCDKEAKNIPVWNTYGFSI